MKSQRVNVSVPCGLFVSILAIFFISGNVISQKITDVRIVKAFKGFDIVSYNQLEKPAKGVDEFTFHYKDLKFKFISAENRELFKSDPDKYLPQYGGNCAYGIALSGNHFWGNPKSYEIYDGKLYFFFKRSFLDYRKKWLKNGADSLRLKADENWHKQVKG